MLGQTKKEHWETKWSQKVRQNKILFWPTSWAQEQKLVLSIDLTIHKELKNIGPTSHLSFVFITVLFLPLSPFHPCFLFLSVYLQIVLDLLCSVLITLLASKHKVMIAYYDALFVDFNTIDRNKEK